MERIVVFLRGRPLVLLLYDKLLGRYILVIASCTFLGTFCFFVFFSNRFSPL